LHGSEDDLDRSPDPLGASAVTVGKMRHTRQPSGPQPKKLPQANRGFIDFDKTAVNFFQCRQCGGEKKGCPVCQAQIMKGATFKEKYVRQEEYFKYVPGSRL